MDPTTRALMAAGGGGSLDPVYVEDVFSTWIYTGNGSTQTITNGIDLSGEGGLVWLKCRAGSSAASNVLCDTARGTSKSLLSDSTNAEYSGTAYGVTAFNADGFSLNSSNFYDNNSAATYASWTFRKAEKFFDVVTYTGNDTNRTIAHNLGSVPGCIIVKKISGSASWNVYHRSTGNTNVLFLNLTDAATTDSARWNNTTPTATEFSLGTSDQVNQSGNTYVAYLFAHDAGGFGENKDQSVIHCGSFTTDGSGFATVNLGWEPQWILYKRSSGEQNWFIRDNMRGWSKATNAFLYPNLANAEVVSTGDFTSPNASGFQFGPAAGALSGSSTYVYIAIRRGPMKTPTDATKVFQNTAYTGQGSTATTITTAFPVDFTLNNQRTTTSYKYFAVDRLRGSARTFDVTGGGYGLSDLGTSNDLLLNSVQNGLVTSLSGGNYFPANQSGFTYINHSFRRAPGFFDITTWNSGTNFDSPAHNLGVLPELVLVKSISSTDWVVAYDFSGAGSFNAKSLRLNKSDSGFSEVSTSAHVYAYTTSMALYYGGRTPSFANGRVIAYLFASCPGVSKVGTYTGTGNTLNIDCGFTNGARFVMIKRFDASGAWYVWDTARGIVSGNDPYLLMNGPGAAEVTNTDYIDPLASGFQISSTAPAAINANGGSFLYLAIA